MEPAAAGMELLATRPPAGQVLVSRTIRDLMARSDYVLEDRGPVCWRMAVTGNCSRYAAAGPPPPPDPELIVGQAKLAKSPTLLSAGWCSVRGCRWIAMVVYAGNSHAIAAMLLAT